MQNSVYTEINLIKFCNIHEQSTNGIIKIDDVKLNIIIKEPIAQKET